MEGENYAPSVTLTHPHDTHHLFKCIRTTLSPLDLWTDPTEMSALLARWTEMLADGPQTGRSDPHMQLSLGRQQHELRAMWNAVMKYHCLRLDAFAACN